MKAIVLAGGYATRLWPITRNRPKMFLPVGEGTVIDDVFADLEADERVDEVYVSTNERFAEDFETYLANSEFEKPVISVEETVDEDEKFGVVGALAQLIDRENLDDDLIVVAGDNVISFDLAEFGDFFEEQGTPCIAAYDVESKERAKSYGLVELAGDRIVDFQEKPAEPKSTLVSIACYAFPQETLPKFESYLAGENNPDEPGWFIEWLQSREAVHAFTFDGAWFDIGTPESYLEAVAWKLRGENLVADDATVENSELGENVHVMAGATIEDAELTNSIVFEDAAVVETGLERSIVDKDSYIEGLDLDGALVGAHSEIRHDDD